jgi:hypothetical protein
MPKGDRLKLKADPEDGTTPIANLLLEAVAIAKLSGLEVRAIIYLWRRTYGWVGKDGKRLKECKVGLTEWGKALDSSNARLSHTLQDLEHKGIIKRKLADVWGGYSYSINTNISQWNSDCVNFAKLCERVGIPSFATVDQTATVNESDNSSKSDISSQQDNSIPKTFATVDQTATEQLTKTQPPTLYKEILNKDIKKEDDKLLPLNTKGNAGEVFRKLDTLRGYKPPKRKGEASSILRMLRTYTADQIIDTWVNLKKEKFWEDKELYMMNVEDQIGAKIKKTNGGKATEVGKYEHMVQHE